MEIKKLVTLLVILFVLSGCQPVAESVKTTPFSPSATVEPAPLPPTPTATAEPVKTAAATKSGATASVKETPATATAEPIEIDLTLRAVAESVAKSAATVAAVEPTPMVVEEGMDSVTITVVYDNNRYDPRLQTAWGFGCLVETEKATILFDTGGDGPTLLSNMATLEIDPQTIEVVVLSHIHGDHTAGLEALLSIGARPTVYLPRSFPTRFKADVRSLTALEEVTGPAEILPGVYTTGELGSGIVEQALAVETPEGLVVITGCAHPGVAEMVRRAKQISEAEVYLVLGGFHLGDASQEKVEGIIADFRELGVRHVAPCHCTGNQATKAFADAFGADFIPNGVGYVMTVGTQRE